MLTNAFEDQMALYGITDFSYWWLLWTFVFGVIGFYVFMRGRKNGNWGVLWSGVGLMVYPMFISGAWMSLIVGLGLCAAAYYFEHNGGPRSDDL